FHKSADGAGEVEAAAKCLEIAIKHGADTETPTTELERILGELVAAMRIIGGWTRLIHLK
ncbi:MAG: hypothetical protein GY800_12505, partial [Planctomycetes bacterium]|nr:hypothetical protein [Planctomycetota bacterium]